MKDDRNDPFKLPSYEIGYRRPPADRQFVKGKSGNPQGRPKKKMQAAKLPSVDPSTRDRFLKSTSYEVTIREGDAVKKIPLTEAIFKVESVAAKLPTRMQLDDTHLLIRTARIGVLRKPVLQQQLKHHWAEFGLQSKRCNSVPYFIINKTWD
jgi:hypothetical protein